MCFNDEKLNGVDMTKFFIFGTLYLSFILIISECKRCTKNINNYTYRL